MSQRSRACTLALAVLLVAPTLAFAQGAKAGVVTTLEGPVTVTSAVMPQPRLMKFKDDVFVNDRIVTGDRAIARMLLGGKAVVTVRERSALTITEVPGKSTIALDAGKIAIAVAPEKMKPGDQVEVRTPNAVAGVRGTVFIAEVTRATASLDAAQGGLSTLLYVLTGSVAVVADGQSLIVPANTFFSRTGSELALRGVLTPELRAHALAGLQTRPKAAGGVTQEHANEQAMGTTVATFGGSAAAIEPAADPLAPPPLTLLPPILPGGDPNIRRLPAPVVGERVKTLPTGVVIFGDRADEAAALRNHLASLGSSLTLSSSTLPADLSAFGTIWHVGAFAPLTTVEQTRLRDFLAHDGGLHLTGERPCCEPLNASLTSFLHAVVVGGADITVGNQGDILGPYTFNPAARGGVTVGLSSWAPLAPGGMVGVSGANVLVTGAAGAVVGGVWDREDLVGAAGRLTLLMDVNWLAGAGAREVIDGVERFIDDPPSMLRLQGPLLRASAEDLGTAGDTLLGIGGYSVLGSSDDPLVWFSGSTVALPGSLLHITDSTVTNGGTLVRGDGGTRLVQSGSDPLVWMSGSAVNVGVGGSGHLIDLAGRATATETDADTGLLLGTDRPIQPGAGAPLVQADNGSRVAVAGHAFRVDTAVLAATAPLLALNGGSALMTAADAVALVRQARVEIPGDAVSMLSLRGGLLTVGNGHLVSVAGGSRLSLGGSLLSLSDGSAVSILNGTLLSVSGGSIVSIGGSLVSFSGTGNTLSVTNSLVPTALIGGIPVYGPASSVSVAGSTALAGLGTAGTITINGVPLTSSTPLSSLKGSLIAVQGGGTVKIGP
jgi:hypothetical protein